MFNDRIPGYRQPDKKVSSLDIIFRSCTRVHNIQSVGRPCGATKRDVVLCCLKSLLNSITEECTIHVLDDHSPDKDTQSIINLLKSHSERHIFVPITSTGNGESLRENFQYGKNKNFDLMYFCEDDYLHTPEAIPSMLDFYKTSEYDCVIFPADYIDRYTENPRYKCHLFLGKDRHWRSIRHTTATFLVSKRILNKYWPKYTAFAEFNIKGHGGENESVNKVYQKELCVSPIPSLAAHFSTRPDMPPFTDWEKLFQGLRSQIT